VAAMGGLDGVAFTGGIGEHSAEVRAGIVRGLGYLGAVIGPGTTGRANAADSRVAIWIVPAEEEAQIAREAMTVMEAEARG
jgi:acetate kinase